jgi:hypothetical protein
LLSSCAKEFEYGLETAVEFANIWILLIF